MISRCHRVYSPQYDSYGARGIKVCWRWRRSFWNFVADVGMPPTPAHSIDRIDVNGNYEPGNVRWATMKEQNTNKRNSLWLEHNGRRLPLVEWSKITGITNSTIHRRFVKGLSSAEILSPAKRLRDGYQTLPKGLYCSQCYRFFDAYFKRQVFCSDECGRAASRVYGPLRRNRRSRGNG